MAGLKTIRRRISSVKNTKQITRAMKLVSAAKLRRAQDAALSGRAYIHHLDRIMKRLVVDLPPNFTHPLLERREVIKNRRVIAISGERGLCGAYNTNLMKAVQAELENSRGSATDVVAIGRRAVSSGHRLGWNLVGAYEGLPENAGLWPIEEIGAQLVHDFSTGACDEVVLYYTKFYSAMTQTVTKVTLLPFGAAREAEEAGDGTATSEPAPVPGVVKYSPTPLEIFSHLIPILVNAWVRQAGLESKASEHAARMSAMDSATNNAEDLIQKLRLFYNRARQSSITRDLMDIIGGAEAIK